MKQWLLLPLEFVACADPRAAGPFLSQSSRTMICFSWSDVTELTFTGKEFVYTHVLPSKIGGTKPNPAAYFAHYFNALGYKLIQFCFRLG
jgi:hypothetical protein